MGYLKYYVTILVFNAAILSFNGVLAFTDSPTCETADGLDMTSMFDMAFVGGFVLNCCNFVFFAFADPFIRF